MIFRYRSIVVLFLGLAFWSGCQSASALQDEVGASPLQVYHEVWLLVKDKYYDPSFNGQDWSRWEHKYDKQITTKQESQKAIETMLSSLNDRYTRYLNDSLFDDEKDQIVERFFGVGLALGLGKTGAISITAPIQGTPAARAGLRSGDEIIAINGKGIPRAMDVQQAVRYIRGPYHTKVVLTVRRGNERKQFSLIRDEMSSKSLIP